MVHGMRNSVPRDKLSFGSKGRALVSKQPMFWLLVACIGMGVLFLTGWPGSARAIDLDGIKITPSVAYQGEYDDNLFRTPSDKKSDYINHYIPAITLEATPGQHDIKADLSADILRFSKFTNQDTERYFANFSGIFKFNQLELRGKEDFAHTDDFPSSELTTRIKRNENYLGGGFDFDVYGQWGIGFDTTWGDIYYLDHSFDFLSRDTYTYATNLYYRISPKTRLFAEYDYVQEFYKYDNTRNDDRQRGLLGVRGDLMERLSLTAKGGYEHLSFQDPTQGNQNLFAGWLEANYRPVERLQIALLISQDPEASAYETNFTYTPFSTALAITYAITPKITVIPHGFFGVNRYNQATLNTDNNTTEKRQDTIYGGGLGIRYEVQKWIRFEVNYEYTGRNSNFSTFNYDDNRVWFTITFSI